MLRSTQNITAKKMLRMFEDGEIDFNLNVQRGLIWDVKRKSLLIDSLIHDYPVPQFYVVKKDGVLHFLDGQQRTDAIVGFLRNEYPLSHNITQKEYTGHLFCELPIKMQEDIEGYSLTVCEVTPKNDAELEEVFIRINNGISLTSFDLTRSKAGKQVIDFVETIIETPFFKQIPFSKVQIRKHWDEEVVLHSMGLITSEIVSFTAKQIRDYVEGLRTNGIPDTTKERMIALTDYLNEMKVPVEMRSKCLKRTTIPIIYYVAHKTNMELPIEEFQNRVQRFLNTPTSKYKLASITRTSCARSVADRCSELLNAVVNNIYGSKNEQLVFSLNGYV